MNVISVIFILFICGGGGIGMLIFMKKSDEKKVDPRNVQQETAQEFVNVIDIHDRFLYTRDGQVIAYLKIQPISIDLFSDMEKDQICKVLTAELSSLSRPFKFLAVSRPVDIAPLVSEYQTILAQTSDRKQKELLRNEMVVMSNYAVSGEVVERQFYIMLWMRYSVGCEQDLLKECREFAEKFESANIHCEIIKEHEIVRLCNLINNPAYTHLED